MILLGFPCCSTIVLVAGILVAVVLPSSVSSQEACGTTCPLGYNYCFAYAGLCSCCSGGACGCFSGGDATNCLYPVCCASYPVVANAGNGNCQLRERSGYTCTPQCLAGYYLAGNVSLSSTCSVNGWINSGTCTHCLGLPTVLNGFTGDCLANPTAAGYSCNPVCAPGYAFTNNIPLLASCLSSGWSVANSCTPCVGYPFVANGNTGNCAANVSVGFSCQPQCNVGFFADGLLAQCTAAGWILTAPCRPKCMQPPSISPELEAGNCKADVPSGFSCTLNCTQGYRVNGSLSLTCADGGVWTTASGFCSFCGEFCGETCAAPIIPDGYSAGTCVSQAVYGDTCVLTCGRNDRVSSTGTLTLGCNNGEWTAPTAWCIPPVTLDSIGQLPMASFSALLSIISAAILAVGAVVFLVTRIRFCNDKEKVSQVFRVFLACLSAADFLSDLSVLIDTNNRNQEGLLTTYITVMTVFLVLPMATNAVYVGRLLYNYIHDSDAASHWVRQNIVSTSFVSFVSLFSSENVLLVSSHCFGWGIFSGPAPSASFIDRVELSGVWTNILEDIPQVLIQILLASQLGRFSPLIVMSISFSLIAVGVALARRFLVFALMAAEKKRVWFGRKASSFNFDKQKLISENGNESSSTGIAMNVVGATTATTAFVTNLHLKRLKSKDIADILTKHNFDQYAKVFICNELSGRFLLALSDDEMQDFVADASHRAAIQLLLQQVE